MIGGRAGELLGAVALLTRLPVPDHEAPPADCVWAYPLVGICVGLIGSVAFHLGLPQGPAALVALALAALTTGGLHEDGLADSFDALGGGRTPARRLEILKDSRIGAHGALALVLAMSVRGAALAAMPPPIAAGAFVAASALSRAAMLPMLGLARPARANGLASPLARTAWPRLGAGMGIGLVTFVALAPAGRGLVLPVLLAIVTCVWFARIATRRFGGYTGDLLGATCLVAECGILIGLA